MVLDPPPRPPRATDVEVDRYLFDLYRWADKLWRKLGKGGVQAAELDISGSATTAAVAVQAASVSNLAGSGSPEGAVSASEGQFYLDNDTGTWYRRPTGSGTGSVGWIQI